MDVARERRVFEVYETVVDWPAATRESRLVSLAGDDPVILDAVRALIRGDAATATLQTISSEPIDAGPETIPDRIGVYRIVGELGRGGMGTVFLGERDDGLFEQQVAIKLIRHGLFSPAALDQFAVERRILARLHHPHIAQLLDGGVGEDGTSYIVMELLDGAPITDHADALALGLDARLTLFIEACGAIEHAHRNLVVHSDIKPSNVLVTADFGVKLLDFGIARLLNQADDPGLRAHTPGYASPAQRDGLPPSPADDVHALGVLLWTLLEAQTVDDDLAAVARKAAADDPARRYGAVSELLDDIVRWRARRPVSARTAEPLHRAGLYWRRHRLGLSIVLATFVVLVATAATTTTLYFRATAAQNAAERRFEQTRSLSQFLIGDVTQALAPLPGSRKIRREIAERANRTLEELSRVPGASPQLRGESATAYSRVGTILTGAVANEAAVSRDANRALTRAIAVLQDLDSATPGGFDLALSLARAQIGRAEFRIQAQNDPAGALRDLDGADRGLAVLAKAHPRSISVANARWDAALARAAALDNQGEFAANLAALRTVVARFPALPLPRDADRVLRIDRGLSFLASAEWYTGHLPESFDTYRKAARALADPAFATDARVAARQAYAAYNLAAGYSDQGDERAGLAAILPGVAAIERLRNFDDNPATRNMENMVRMAYAANLAGLKRYDAAIAQAQRSIIGRRALAALQPNSYAALRTVPVGLRPLAETYESAGRRAQACDTMALADREWAKIAAHRKLSDFDANDERNQVRKALAKCGGAR